jgi:hypothetical protein
MGNSQDSCIEFIHCDSAKDFLHVLSLANPIWGKGLNRPWLFRGHADENWKLVPPAWRTESAEFYEPLLKQFRELAAKCLSKTYTELESNGRELELDGPIRR